MSHINRKSDSAPSGRQTKAIGSVIFFKRLIIAFLSLLMFSLLFACVMLRIQNDHLAKETGQLQSDLETVQMELNIAKSVAATQVSPAAASPAPTVEAAVSQASFPYQALYPELYCKPQIPVISPAKTLFLTFDDGPSENTVKVLDILKKYNIKATFFVIGGESKRNTELMQRIVAEGHSIGVHTYTHNYDQIYASIEAYLADFKKEYDLIYRATGVKATIFRFPGGSINSYNRNIYQQLIAEMTRRGFTYYDWSISSGDGAATTTAAAFKNNILTSVDKLGHGIILMHDSAGRTNTIGILEEVIVNLISKGYKFAPINNEVMPVTFLYLQ